MNLKRLAMALMVLVIGSGVHAASKRGPSTAEERRKAIELTRQLESDPLGPSAKEARHWLGGFFIDVPDIDFTVCADLFGALLKSKHRYSPEINTQMIFASGVFVIEHPDRASDQLAIFQAAAEGALRVYDSILTREPESRMTFLDNLVKRRNDGTLADYVREASAKCK